MADAVRTRVGVDHGRDPGAGRNRGGGGMLGCSSLLWVSLMRKGDGRDLPCWDFRGSGRWEDAVFRDERRRVEEMA